MYQLSDYDIYCLGHLQKSSIVLHEKDGYKIESRHIIMESSVTKLIQAVLMNELLLPFKFPIVPQLFTPKERMPIQAS